MAKRHINNRGASMMEYAILVSLIAMAVLAATKAFGMGVNVKYDNITDALNGGNVVGMCAGGGNGPNCHP